MSLYLFTMNYFPKDKKNGPLSSKNILGIIFL